MYAPNCVLPPLSNLSPWRTRKDTLQDFDNFTYDPYEIFNNQIRRPIQQLNHKARINYKSKNKKSLKKNVQQNNLYNHSKEKNEQDKQNENEVLIHINQRGLKSLNSYQNTPKNRLRSKDKERQYNSALQQRQKKEPQKTIQLGPLSANTNQIIQKQQMLVMKQNKLALVQKPPIETTLTVRMFQIQNQEFSKSNSKQKAKKLKKTLQTNTLNFQKENYNFLSLQSKNKKEENNFKIFKAKGDNRYVQMNQILPIRDGYSKNSSLKLQGIEKQKQSISLLRSYERNYRILESETTINNVLRKTIQQNQFKFK